MPKASQNLSHRKRIQKKFCLLRVVVIVLSMISLISRVIYCTFATWLTITTFDCIPCPNTTSRNGTSDLFTAHHSSAVFKTVRSLNIDSGVKKVKRAYDLKDWKYFSDNDSDFAKDDSSEQFRRFDTTSSDDQNYELVSIQNETFSDNSSQQNITEEVINNLLIIEPEIADLLSDSMFNKSDEVSAFFGDDVGSDSLAVPSVYPSSNLTNGTDFERFTYMPREDLFSGASNSTLPSNDEINDFDIFQKISKSNNFTNSSKETIVLDERVLNISKIVPKRGHKSVINTRRANKSYVTKSLMNVCSEDCAQFLNIELSDADVRKWATIVITGVLYLYAFVMFCIFISACLALVDLLVLSTFIEGAKLFAGFILIIIDSFNGREIHFDLIDLKFNVNSGGNGWTADFSYSEYLLDIIIFFLSIILCIRVFKCFERRPRKGSSIEELNETRGTYRANPSRASLEPIFEHN